MQYLHQIGLIHILPGLISSIQIPPAVVHELAAGRALGVDVPDPANLAWVMIQTPTAVLPAHFKLGAGESEVLRLALANLTSIAALDDSEARRVAHSLGVRFTGTLGLLLDAKQSGLIPAVKPYLDELTRRGFYLSAVLRATILVRAAETP
jgi:predicted nucleic acid-binding protein